MKMHKNIDKAFDLFRVNAQRVADMLEAPEDYETWEQDDALESLENDLHRANKKYGISMRELNGALDMQHEYTIFYARTHLGEGGVLNEG